MLTLVFLSLAVPNYQELNSHEIWSIEISSAPLCISTQQHLILWLLICAIPFHKTCFSVCVCVCVYLFIFLFIMSKYYSRVYTNVDSTSVFIPLSSNGLASAGEAPSKNRASHFLFTSLTISLRLSTNHLTAQRNVVGTCLGASLCLL